MVDPHNFVLYGQGMESEADLVQRALQDESVDLKSLAQKVGVSYETVRKWRSGHTAPNRNRIAKVMQLLNLSQSQTTAGGELRAALRRQASAEMIDVPLLDVAGSMGNGRPQPELDVVVDHLPISRSWLTRNANFSQPEKLTVIAAFGDSMSPTFSNGDLLLVDTGVSGVTLTDVRVDSVYVLSLDGELFIKRLQRDPVTRKALMISDNPSYKTIEIPHDSKAQFAVLGVVVMAWNARRIN